jgi:3'(2'), 5'-bisphosphate nucleotidase
VRGRTYAAARGLGAWRHDGGAPPRPIRPRPAERSRLVVATSRDSGAASARAFVERLEAMGAGVETLRVSSALKFGLVAEGAADLYYRPFTSSAWDVAAGQLVVEEAGGIVTDLAGRSVSYHAASAFGPSLVACGDPALDVWEAYLPA